MSEREVNVVFSATTSKFSSGIKEAESGLKNFVESSGGIGEGLKAKFEGLGNIFTGGGIEGIFQGMQGGLSHIAESAGGALAELGPVGIALGAVAGVAAVAAAAVVGFGLAVKSIVEPAMEMIDATYKMARSMDVPIDALMTFHQVAKAEGDLAAEDIDKAMKTLAKNVGEALQQPTGEAAESLKNLGLSAKQLAGGGLDQAFTQVVDKLSQVNSTAVKASDANALLGREGLVIAGAFREGAEGIEKAHEAGLKMGTVLSAMDAAKVEAAHDKFEQLGFTLTGIANKITVALAPTIEFIGQKILDIIPSADTFANVFTGAVKVIAYGIAGLEDGWTVLKIGVLAFGTGAVAVFAGIVTAIEAVTEGIVKAHNLFSKTKWEVPEGLKNFAEESRGMTTAMAQQTADAINDLANNSAISKVPGFLDQMAAKNSDDAIDKLRDDAHKAGDAMADAMVDAAQKAKEKIQSILEGLGSDLQFQKFLGSSLAQGLKAAGVDESSIKKVFEVKENGGDDKQINQAVNRAKGLAQIEQFNKGQDAIKGLQDKLAALQAAASKGIDPKLAEEIQKLKLSPDQADQYTKLAAGIKKLEDAAQVKDKIKELREEVEALQHGMSVDDWKIEKNATPEQQAELKKLEAQKAQLEGKDDNENKNFDTMVRRSDVYVNNPNSGGNRQEQLLQQSQQQTYWQQNTYFLLQSALTPTNNAQDLDTLASSTN